MGKNHALFNTMNKRKSRSIIVKGITALILIGQFIALLAIYRVALTEVFFGRPPTTMEVVVFMCSLAPALFGWYRADEVCCAIAHRAAIRAGRRLED